VESEYNRIKRAVINETYRQRYEPKKEVQRVTYDGLRSKQKDHGKGGKREKGKGKSSAVNKSAKERKRRKGPYLSVISSKTRNTKARKNQK